MTEGTASFSASMTDELRSAPKQEPIDMAHLGNIALKGDPIP